MFSSLESCSPAAGLDAGSCAGSHQLSHQSLRQSRWHWAGWSWVCWEILSIWWWLWWGCGRCSTRVFMLWSQELLWLDNLSLEEESWEDEGSWLLLQDDDSRMWSQRSSKQHCICWMSSEVCKYWQTNPDQPHKYYNFCRGNLRLLENIGLIYFSSIAICILQLCGLLFTISYLAIWPDENQKEKRKAVLVQGYWRTKWLIFYCLSSLQVL